MPVPVAVPPQLAVYHATYEPEPPEEVKTIVPPVFEHKLLLLDETDDGFAGPVIITVVAVLQTELLHVAVSHLA